MDAQLIEKARAVDLVGLIGRDTRLRGGLEKYGPCPFCGGVDRLHVNPRKGWFCRQCTGAPAGGGRWLDAIAYVQRRDGLDFRGAVLALAGGDVSSTFKPEPPARPVIKNLPGDDWQRTARTIAEQASAALWSDAGARARAWLNARGLSDDTIKAAGLGYIARPGKLAGIWVANGIVIPWLVGGRIYKLNVRRLAGEPKYRAIAGSVNGHLYLADKMRGLPDVIVTEGEFDALLAWQFAGDFADVVTLGSATARIRDDALPYLIAGRRFWLCTDNDAEGERAADYWLALVGGRGQRIYPPNRAKDLTDAWRAGADLANWATKFCNF